MPLADNPDSGYCQKSRSGIAEDGSVLKGTKAVTFGEALFETIIHHLQRPQAVAYGEKTGLGCASPSIKG